MSVSPAHGSASTVLVVGSVALDSVETPFGRADDVLGGSGTFFASSASHFAPVQLVGVVGDDYPVDKLQPLTERGVDLSNEVGPMLKRIAVCAAAVVMASATAHTQSPRRVTIETQPTAAVQALWERSEIFSSAARETGGLCDRSRRVQIFANV